MEVGIPAHIKESLQAYVKEGRPTGDFLRAVLENNLSESFGRADIQNRNRLFAIVSYIYNELPADCWGSADKVKNWLNEKTK